MATLKISDLSVGDWVQYRDREWQVCSLYQFTGEVGLWRKDSQICENVADCKPIPITAEILEKNGFEKYSEREWGCNDDSPYHTFIHIDTPDETMWFISFPTIFNLTWDHPRYNIHQLQHLIRLAGVDKEINL